MKPVCVLGNGQLGRMLRQAGEPLGIQVIPVGTEQVPQQIDWQRSIITAEIERWPNTPFTQLLAQHDNFVNRNIFSLLADRLSQKQLLDKLHLANAPWYPLEQSSQWPELFDELGDFLVVKSRVGGYDGRGQWRVHQQHPLELPQQVYGNCIVEQGIPFDAEVSLVGARGYDGTCVFYPLTCNLHEQGILRASIASPLAAPALQPQAEKMLSAIMHELNYIGVMAMECFITADNQLLINELAPRVHNSGHWTQNGATVSQFELHLRAITDLPLLTPIVESPSLMINLIGSPLDYRWLSVDLVHLHWYDKEVRAGRKLGHLNLTHSNIARLLRASEQLATLLSSEYQSGLEWSRKQLIKLSTR